MRCKNIGIYLYLSICSFFFYCSLHLMRFIGKVFGWKILKKDLSWTNSVSFVSPKIESENCYHFFCVYLLLLLLLLSCFHSLLHESFHCIRLFRFNVKRLESIIDSLVVIQTHVPLLVSPVKIVVFVSIHHIVVLSPQYEIDRLASIFMITPFVPSKCL